MMAPRGEARTEQGWQRFDRVAFIVTLLLTLALFVVWFSGVTPTSPPTDPLAAAALDDVAEPGAVRDRPTPAVDKSVNALIRLPTSQSTAGPPSLPTAQSAQPPATGNAVVTTQPESGPQKAASDGPKGSSEDGLAGAKSQSVSGSAKLAVNTAAGNQQNVNEVASSGGQGQSAGARVSDGKKSLASQDPSKQATFERIPKYLDQPIVAGTQPLAERTELPAKPGSLPAQNGLPAVLPATTGDGPKIKPILELRSANGSLIIDGIVSSEKVRTEILKAGLKTYGMRNLTDRLVVNAAVDAFTWAGDAADLIVLIGGPENDTTLRIDGSSVTLTGAVPTLEDKQARALAAQQLFGTRARVDNRLRVVVRTERPTAQAMASAGGSPAEPEAGPSAASGPDNSAGDQAADESTARLAEGGPGQKDSVTLLPTAIPEKFARGDCPKIATGVLLPFASGSIELTEAAKAALNRLRPCFMRRNYFVGAHTDGRGLAANNLVLSQARAEAVVDYLIAQGVPESRLTAIGYGESKPIISNRSERGRARNRRVDFRFKRY